MIPLEKAMAMINPNENKRALSKLIMPDFVSSTFTSHMTLSDFWNSTKTPVAPNKMVNCLHLSRSDLVRYLPIDSILSKEVPPQILIYFEKQQ